VPDLRPHSDEPDSPTIPVWQQGLTVGRYSLLTRLARGGMAEIWLARQVGLQGFEKFVVIKRILEELVTDTDFVTMFLDEARLAAQLNHPHIVQIFDLGEESGAFYIAMEYLPGENLAILTRTAAKQNKPLPLVHAVRIIADAAEGLAYAHARRGAHGEELNIVHRDVSPQNLLVTYDGGVKVLDFGIAKAAARESHTEVGLVKGKAAYMSPEQARGETLDGRSDIFSLGTILFELVTRTRLFPAPSPAAALHMVAGNTPIPLAHERAPHVPEALGHIIARALARQPAQRFASAYEFQVALEHWLRGQPEVANSAELALYMADLFGDRIEERARLLEAARAGDLSLSSVRRAARNSSAYLPELAQTSESQPATNATPPRRWGAWIAAASALVLLGSAGAWRLSRQAPTTEPSPHSSILVAPTPPVLTIETEPPGARLLVDGEDVGRSPKRLDTLLLGEHLVQAELEGRTTAQRQVTLLHPGERAMVVLALAPAPAPPPPTPAPPASAEPVATETPAATSPRAAKRAMGKLTLDTTPWTRVSLRGRKLGDTPLIEQALPAGRYQLKLVNDEKNISTVIEVEIRPGQVTAKKLRL
jgi:eukaryotic-like serine/threonine-protein kinase